MLDPQSVIDYTEHLHREFPPCQELYDQEKDRLEEAWHARFCTRDHDGMSAVPSYLSEDRSEDRWKQRGMSLEDARQDGHAFTKAYLQDAQFIFSRVQEHIHRRTKKGYLPLRGCLSAKCKDRRPGEIEHTDRDLCLAPFKPGF